MAAQDPPHRRRFAHHDHRRARALARSDIEESLRRQSRRTAARYARTSRRGGRAAYHDEGYTFARVRHVVRRGFRRPDDRRSTKASSTRSTSRVSTNGSPNVRRRIRAARRRRVQQAPRASGARRAAAADARRGHDRSTIRSRRCSPTARDCTSGAVRSIWSIANGQRVLLVGLREPAGRFKIVPDLGDREDWFTPVDGFVPSLGIGRRRVRARALQSHLRRRTPLGKDRLGARRLCAWLRAAAVRPDEAVRGRRAPRPDGHRRSVAGVVGRGEPRRDRAAAQLSRLLPPPWRADCGAVRIASAGRGAVRRWRGERHERACVDERFQPVERRRTVPAEPRRERRPPERGRCSARRSTAAASIASRSKRPTGVTSSTRCSASGSTTRTASTMLAPIWRIDWTSELSDAGRARQRLRFPAPHR